MKSRTWKTYYYDLPSTNMISSFLDTSELLPHFRWMTKMSIWKCKYQGLQTEDTFNFIAFKPLKGTVHPKILILPSFTHPQVVPNLNVFLSSEHKIRYFEECLYS